MPVLEGITDWSPFNIDALGLVTLLGANSLQKALGRLVQHPWAECFPLLAGHVIPDDLILEPIPGFMLYNLTDQIRVNGVNAWFSRWLMCQGLSTNSTVLNIEIAQWRKKPDRQDISSTILGLLLHAFLIVFSVLIKDWYGFAASVSLSLSTLTRVIVLILCRKALDDQVADAQAHSTTAVKLLVDLPNNKTVTVYTTRGVVIKALVAETRPGTNQTYRVLRGLGWTSFGVFIVALGMTSVAIQIIMAVLLITSSMVVIQRWGCNESYVGSSLRITMHTPPGPESHMRTWAVMQLTEKEEDAMVKWSLFPLRTNERWWNTYRAFCNDYQKDLSASEAA